MRGPRQRAFTVAELLVAMAFATLLGALVWTFARTSFSAAAAQQARSESQDTAHLALSVLTRDLRQAGFAPGLAPPLALARAEAGRIALRADLDGDGDCDDSGESVAYQEDPARRTLTRAVGAAPPQPLADHLLPGGLRFAYFDAIGTRLEPGGTGLSADDRARVKRVDVGIALAAPAALGPARVVVSASVELRNAP